MPARVAAMAVLSVLLIAPVGKRWRDGSVQQRDASIPGHLEPNNPGAPGVPASAKLQALLGSDPDLTRSATCAPGADPPRPATWAGQSW